MAQSDCLSSSSGATLSVITYPEVRDMSEWLAFLATSLAIPPLTRQRLRTIQAQLYDLKQVETTWYNDIYRKIMEAINQSHNMGTNAWKDIYMQTKERLALLLTYNTSKDALIECSETVNDMLEELNPLRLQRPIIQHVQPVKYIHIERPLSAEEIAHEVLDDLVNQILPLNRGHLRRRGSRQKRLSVDRISPGGMIDMRKGKSGSFEEERTISQDPLPVCADMSGKVSAKSDAHCVICFGAASLAEDLIVYCEGCGITVHQSCYGIIKVPEGDWKCARCEANKSVEETSCILCGRLGGAVKPMIKASFIEAENPWVHLVCCLWDYDVSVEDVSAMEPIAFVRQPSWTRSSEAVVCTLCNRRGGYCITCCWEDCSRPFHVSCAREHGYLALDTSSGIMLQQAYCDRHKHHRVDIVEILRHMLLPKVCSGALSRGQISKLEEICNRVQSQTYYQSLDNVTKDIVRVLQKANDSRRDTKDRKKKAPEPALAQMYRMLFDRLPQLEKVYPSCTMREYELLPQTNAMWPHIEKSREDVLNQVMIRACDVCTEPFDLYQHAFYCNGQCETGVSEDRHMQHAGCMIHPRAKGGKKTKKFTRNRERLSIPSRSFNEAAEVGQSAVLSGINYNCGSCSALVDTSAIIHVSEWKKDKKKVDTTNSRGKNVTGKIGADLRPASALALPDFKTLNLESTRTWMEMIPPVLEIQQNSAPGMAQQNIDEHTMEQLGSLLENIKDDKYARSKIKKAILYLKRKRGPFSSILRFLQRDYRCLIKKREQHDITVAKLEEAKRLAEEEEKRKKHEAELKEKEAEILLKRQQAEIKQNLKRKKVRTPTGARKQAKLDGQVKREKSPDGSAGRKKRGPARVRYQRCNNCEACKSKDCQKCVFCVDMKKYGGSGTRKRGCISRVCLYPIPVPLTKSKTTVQKEQKAAQLLPPPVGLTDTLAANPAAVATAPTAGTAPAQVPNGIQPIASASSHPVVIKTETLAPGQALPRSVASTPALPAALLASASPAPVPVTQPLTTNSTSNNLPK